MKKKRNIQEEISDAQERIRKAKETVLECKGRGYNITTMDVTCIKCKDAKTCEYAFDSYNLCGDCLAEK